MNSETKASERSVFEKWYTEKYLGVNIGDAFTRHGDGYARLDVHYPWLGWEASAARTTPQTLLPCEEIKPCPYINDFSSDNSDVEFMLRDYGPYRELVTFEAGNPTRCFRMATPQTQGVGEDEAVRVMAEAMWDSGLSSPPNHYYQDARKAYRALAKNTPPLTGGIRQHDEASASSIIDSTSRESLPNSCERCEGDVRRFVELDRRYCSPYPINPAPMSEDEAVRIMRDAECNTHIDTAETYEQLCERLNRLRYRALQTRQSITINPNIP